ncbi:MAG: hypothetical protein ACLQU2_22550 [Candidatus Binataceae bacterium]
MSRQLGRARRVTLLAWLGLAAAGLTLAGCNGGSQVSVVVQPATPTPVPTTAPTATATASATATPSPSATSTPSTATKSGAEAPTRAFPVL